jgi:hypothetical protein
VAKFTSLTVHSQLVFPAKVKSEILNNHDLPPWQPDFNWAMLGGGGGGWFYFLYTHMQNDALNILKYWILIKLVLGSAVKRVFGAKYHTLSAVSPFKKM